MAVNESVVDGGETCDEVRRWQCMCTALFAILEALLFHSPHDNCWMTSIIMFNVAKYGFVYSHDILIVSQSERLHR